MYRILAFTITVFLLCCSCNKFLDKKSDGSLAVPSTIEDAEALLDNDALFSSWNLEEGAADDYFLTNDAFNAMSVSARNVYEWDADFNPVVGTWGGFYQNILLANTSIQALEKLGNNDKNNTHWSDIMGRALFYRAFNHLSLAQVFADPYNPATADELPGIPLKLSAAIDEPVQRGTLAETYAQIVKDLEQAAVLLSADIPQYKTRPSKAAAYGMLARVMLNKIDYTKAGAYADSGLKIYSELLDYNTLNSNKSYPFSLFNKEVIFHHTRSGLANLAVTRARVDTGIVSTYTNNDLRKILYFKKTTDGYVSFKGSYAGESSCFDGIAVDEMMLIKAECLARAGEYDHSLEVLNELLATRFSTGTYSPYLYQQGTDVLSTILMERRKEMVLRSQRWNDLRRFNQEDNRKTIIYRNINGSMIALSPGDKRYTFLIPQEIISLSGIAQNPR